MNHYMLCLESDGLTLATTETPFAAPNDQQAVRDALAHVEHIKQAFNYHPERVVVFTLHIGPYDPATGLFATSRVVRLYDSTDLDASIDLDAPPSNAPFRWADEAEFGPAVRPATVEC